MLGGTDKNKRAIDGFKGAVVAEELFRLRQALSREGLKKLSLLRLSSSNDATVGKLDLCIDFVHRILLNDSPLPLFC